MCEIEVDAPLPLGETREPASRLRSPKQRYRASLGIRRPLLTPKQEKSVQAKPPPVTGLQTVIIHAVDEEAV